MCKTEVDVTVVILMVIKDKVSSNKTFERARELRRSETRSEKLLWAVLRGNQLSGLKFRRQHPIGPFYADFVCVQHKLVIEIDGGYHDYTFEDDLTRESFLNREGWQVFRVTSAQVEEHPQGVGMMIAERLGLEFEFRRRKGTGSGEMYKGGGDC